ncbi:phage portal protein [Paenibacillus sp. Marseille-Q4541]|uniref:phage portal protein n=1 Tax=Paenibacillus sp. Marseille-Q4541 TaxID=2831522 RepID=UPI001BA7870A|nr:phage portal protein [Paenibacillus sp. Marseille-Q4541]
MGVEVNLQDRRLLEMLGLDVKPGEINVKDWNALKVDTVYACVKILSDSLSKLPMKIYREDEDGISQTAQHSLARLLKLRPNPFMSAADFWKTMEAHRSFGNAYANIEFDRKTGEVVAIWPIDSKKVTVWIDDAGLLGSKVPIMSNKTRMWYEVDTGTGKRKLLPDEVLHFKGSVTIDGLVGVNTLDYLRCSVENASAATQFINNFYKQGLQVKGLIQYTGSLDEPAKKVFLDNFESMASGLENSHRTALLPLGYTFTPMSLSMADAQFLQNTELTIRQIANAFGVKMHQLNDLSKATYANVEQQQLAYYTESQQPILTTYEQECTYKLFMDRELDIGFYTKFNIDALLRADLKTRYEAYRTGIQGGFLAPNEARRREDMAPLPGGDRLYANGNFIPLELAGQQYMKGGDEAGPKKNDESDQGDESNSNTNGDPGDGSGGGASE